MNMHTWIKALKFFTCTLLTSMIIFLILFVLLIGGLPPVGEIIRGASGAEWQSQHFPQEVLYEQLHDFRLDENGVITSLSHDPWITVAVNPYLPGRILTLNVSNLSVESTSAQIFYATLGMVFSERHSVNFTLTEGENIVVLPRTTEYSLFRLDLTNQENISIRLDDVTLSNNLVLSLGFWLALLVLLALNTTILYICFFRYDIISRILIKFQSLISDTPNYSATLPEKFTDFFMRDKFYWICVSIVTALSYGSAITNSAVGIDDEGMRDYFAHHGLLSQGRWGDTLVMWLVDIYWFLPFWKELLGLIILVAALTFTCGIFEKYSQGRFNDKAATVFTCVFVSFPYMADLWIFKMRVVNTGILLFFSALAVYLFAKWLIDKKHFIYGLLSALSLGFASAFFEIAMIFFLVIGFGVMFFSNVYAQKNDHDFFNFAVSVVKIGAVSVGGVIVYQVGAVVLQMLFNVSASGYTAAFIGYDTSSVSAFFRSVVWFVMSFRDTRILSAGSGLLEDRLIWATSVIFVLLSIGYSVWRKRIVVLFCGLLVVVAAYSLMIATGSVWFPFRVLSAFSIFVALCFSFMYMISDRVNWNKIRGSALMGFVIVLVVITQSRDMNKIFYMDYLRYQRDIMVMHSIVNDLGGVDKPVVFIGLLPNTLPNARDVAGQTLFNWDRNVGGDYELRFGRIQAFFDMHGFPITALSHIDANKIPPEVAYMPAWPTDGYIREFDEFVVVRLGLSPRFDR